MKYYVFILDPCFLTILNLKGRDHKQICWISCPLQISQQLCPCLVIVLRLLRNVQGSKELRMNTEGTG
jgi:hypothetical protein